MARVFIYFWLSSAAGTSCSHAKRQTVEEVWPELVLEVKIRNRMCSLHGLIYDVQVYIAHNCMHASIVYSRIVCI
jgi:hypothetical protein